MYHKESRELAGMLDQGNPDELPDLSPYGKRYLGTLRQNTLYNVQLSAILLERAVRLSGKPAGELRLIDYGGGVGITALLARLAGFATVVYVDLYGPVTRDAERIGEHYGLKADTYIHGEMADVVNQGITADILVTRDVIEHIYDLSAFFRQALNLPELKYMVHNTSANIYNGLLKSHFNKIHFEAEYQYFRSSAKVKEGEVKMGYYRARKRMIQDRFPDLKEEELVILASKTRGLIKKDILAAAETYVRDGTTPVEIDHPTNTCEPETGNWAERLLKFEEYRAFAEPFELAFYPGPYNVKRPFGIKRVALSFLNYTLFRLGAGPSIWPSFFIEMKRRDDTSPASYG